MRPATIYVAGNSSSNSGFELGKFANNSYELCNDTTNGTVVNGLAVLTSSGCAVKPGSAATTGVIGVVIANAGTQGWRRWRERTGYVQLRRQRDRGGRLRCAFKYGERGIYFLCHDAGATRPTGTQILGRVLQASSGGTTVQMFLDMPGSNVSSSGAATGSCTNQAVTAVLTGGPTCTTITSAYIDSSVPSTGALASGNYTKASGTSAIADSGVTAGPYTIPWFTTSTTGTAIAFSSTANKAELWGAVLTFPLTTTQVTFYVSTPDNTSNTYDIGVLNSSGNLVAHIGNTAGTTFAASMGWKSLNWTASATLQPGKYYLAITSSCTSTCAQIYGGSTAGFSFLGGPSGTAESVTAGGTLNSGITIPGDNPTEQTTVAWEIH